LKLNKSLLLSHFLVAVLACLIFLTMPRSVWTYVLLVALTVAVAWGTQHLLQSEEFSRWSPKVKAMAGRVDEHVEEIQRERKQLSAILSALIEGVVAIDHESRVLLMNPASEKLFGLKQKAAIGRPVLEVLRQSSLQEVLRRTIKERTALTEEITIHAPHEKTLLVHALPVSYGEDQMGALVAFHDISEIRKLENIRREFVANVSHELRTPLTSIKGYTETLLEGALEDPSHNREFVQTIQDHANQLSRLIEDVLDLSAIEAQRVTYSMTPVSVLEIIERIIKALSPQASAKKIKISHTLSPVLPPVLADKVKLAQVFMNLLENAIKFNKEGGRVTISASAQTDHLSVTIEDTGRGIVREDLPRIFERFYRSNKDRSHDVPGTGLGLAIVKHLVEAHHGTVSAESIPGKGSSFRVTLPLVTGSSFR
jgi:two-component system, OmpR family, phosphate regulon sensor histidine kinase PhoR